MPVARSPSAPALEPLFFFLRGFPDTDPKYHDFFIFSGATHTTTASSTEKLFDEGRIGGRIKSDFISLLEEAERNEATSAGRPLADGSRTNDS